MHMDGNLVMARFATVYDRVVMVRMREPVIDKLNSNAFAPTQP